MSFLGSNSIVNESGTVSQIENYKIVIIGDQHVGKTSILSRYKYETIEENYAPTVGIDFLTKNVFLEDKTIRLIMWDTAGQERFKSLIPTYLKNANCIILAFDLTNKTSFTSLAKWLSDAKEHVPVDTFFIVCGNKMDLKRSVSQKEAEEFAKTQELPYIEVSALTGDGIEELFGMIVKKLCNNAPFGTNDNKGDVENNNDINSQNIALGDIKKKDEQIIAKKSKCCTGGKRIKK